MDPVPSHKPPVARSRIALSTLRDGMSQGRDTSNFVGQEVKVHGRPWMHSATKYSMARFCWSEPNINDKLNGEFAKFAKKQLGCVQCTACGDWQPVTFPALKESHGQFLLIPNVPAILWRMHRDSRMSARRQSAPVKRGERVDSTRSPEKQHQATHE